MNSTTDDNNTHNGGDIKRLSQKLAKVVAEATKRIEKIYKRTATPIFSRLPIFNKSTGNIANTFIGIVDKIRLKYSCMLTPPPLFHLVDLK